MLKRKHETYSRTEGSPRRVVVTGSIGTVLRRKELASRKLDMKLMKDGCCLSLHELLIIQTPLPPKNIEFRTDIRR